MDKLELFRTKKQLQAYLSEKSGSSNVGLVPTMGALHQGHLSLVDKGFETCDYIVVSIFVNPKQFNNSSDLDNYPRTFESDLELLSIYSNLIVYAPSVEDVYPENYELSQLDLGSLANVMEGKFRPGHFDGVVNVVKRLFEIVQPNKAYFGLKDFQQLAVVAFMTKHFNLPVEIVGCEIYRENSGLASSSRNKRLSEQQKEEALIIYQAMDFVRENLKYERVETLLEQSAQMIEDSPLKLEYLEIVNPVTLKNITEWQSGAQICVAAFCGEVRLIDNLQLTPLD